MPERTARRTGRPRGSAGAQLLEIARGHFLDKGYVATTMDVVAKDARISKSSLYREYATKELLFEAVVTDWVDQGYDAMRPHTDALLSAPDPIEALQRLARTIQAGVLSPPVLQMRSLVTAEAARFPELAADYVTRSWDRNIANLADAFAQLAERGTLTARPAQVAAEQVTWLAVAVPLNRTTLDVTAPPYTRRDLDELADQAVTTFLSRFGPPSGPPK
jgi:AcrR family transcriptional regulator